MGTVIRLTVIALAMRRRMCWKGAVGVIDNCVATVGFDAVLVNEPLKRRAVAEAVGERLPLRIDTIRCQGVQRLL